jgi:7-carboxy-7-deazaguanine synthase (Cx14CxxC type)
VRYTVKELVYTLQGEGARTGRPAVFCRFTGCNLWSGHEADRASAICSFCDTDFVGTDGAGGGIFTRAELVAALAAAWPEASPPGRRYVVFTGGEPLLQLDAELVAACHGAQFEVAVETNGTLPAPAGIDWLTVSPKAGAPLVITAGEELKLAFPQPGLPPERFSGLAFAHFFLQPIAGPDLTAHTRAALAYCLAHPAWRLSLQTHKLLGIP